MIINHNLNAMNAHRNFGSNNVNSAKSMEKLSSGLRINRAGDDAAGLAISEKMRGQIRGLDQASRNSQDGISMIQTAEGALNETHAILQRMRELAVQASNDTNVTKDRDAIQGEMNQLTAEISRIGNTTEFNTQKVLNGGSATGAGQTKTVALQIGANQGQTFDVKLEDMRSHKLRLSAATASTAVTTTSIVTGASGTVSFVSTGTISAANDKTKTNEYALNIGSAKAAGAAVTVINNAINTVSTERAKLGAYQNRLEHTIANLNTASENLSASESRIRDVDMAKEMMAFSKNNILSQAAQAMLAQANQQPQGVLQLLR